MTRRRADDLQHPFSWIRVRWTRVCPVGLEVAREGVAVLTYIAKVNGPATGFQEQ